MLEARANCADAVLLIVATLEDSALTFLAARAREFELDVLCEVHDTEELRRAVNAGCGIIGVNSRDLKTFKVNLGTAMRLAGEIPDGTLAVAESGIESGADIGRLRAGGCTAVLVWEALLCV